MSDHYLKDPRANTYGGWIAALEILAKYDGGLERHMSTWSEHDILYLHGGPEPKSFRYDEENSETVCEWDHDTAPDVETLERLGFHWDSDVECWAKFT